MAVLFFQMKDTRKRTCRGSALQKEEESMFRNLGGRVEIASANSQCAESEHSVSTHCEESVSSENTTTYMEYLYGFWIKERS